MARGTARIAAMQMIFEQAAGGQGGEETLRMVYDEMREENDLGVRGGEPGVADQAWIEQVVQGVMERLDELDEKIGMFSRNWAVDRMPRVDLTILRLGAWEILFEEDVPGSVAINEAVEMANRYSDPASGRFINGVLGAILRQKEAAQ